MKFIGTLVIVLIIYVSVPVSLQALDLRGLTKSKSAFGFEIKSFEYNKGEFITLYGVRHKRYITDHFYFGEAGYGVILGTESRNGYIEGGALLGFEWPLSEKWVSDISLLIGAGGGGADVKEGGGLIIYPSLALGYTLSSTAKLFTHLGYMTYLNGDINSLWVGMNVTYEFWSLNL